MPAPLFARGDVRHVYFQYGKRHRLDRVVQRYAVLGEPGRIDQRAGGAVDMLVQLVDQIAFVVRLITDEVDPQPVSDCPQFLVDFGQGGGAIDVRFAPAEQVQIRAM